MEVNFIGGFTGSNYRKNAGMPRVTYKILAHTIVSSALTDFSGVRE